MVRRIDVNYKDMGMIFKENKALYDNKELIPNLNYLVVVSEAYLKVYQYLQEIVSSNKMKDLTKWIMTFYCESSKLYVIDYLIWTAMVAKHDHLACLPLEHERWKALDAVGEMFYVGTVEQVTQSVQ